MTVQEETEAVSVTTIASCPETTDLCSIAPDPAQKTPFATLKDPGSNTPESTSSFSLSHAKEPAILRPIELKSMLADDQWQTDPSLALSAQQRYALAAAIAKAVLYLSNSPWLDNEWASDQVKLFLHRSASGHDTLSSHAHISHLFDPPPKPPAPSIDRLIPNRVIFALGILLVELAVNEVFQHPSLEAILQGDYPTLRRKLDRVYREAGSLYGNAAQRCVNCEFMGHSSGVDLGLPGFRQQFHDTVVAPLQATYEVFSTLYVM